MSEELKNSILNRGGPLPPPPHDWQKRWRELEQRAAKLEIELEMATNDFNREKQRAIAAEKRLGHERDKFLAPLRAIIPQTYGEAVAQPWIPLGDLPNHEWDNRTTEENAAWIITSLRAAKEAAEQTIAELKRENEKLRKIIVENDRIKTLFHTNECDQRENTDDCICGLSACFPPKRR